ncbi:scavenger receptor cysteine-rich domain-containing group B protein-like [Xenopus laevis]|uniref:Scavenger receptor cysteine-rich domain-containing group B protein-like n=1 Tax=Xenopus laevis TaxID=8355 RepID=A0A8J1L8W6_XENLA|nr:scavenger receptor cysteine-rich domain-containing group B protein-like [Xenopus laevis]
MRVCVIFCAVWAALLRSVDLQVRLVGPSPCEGRVEIFYAQKWGTICYHMWDMIEAEVVCRELNCGTATETTTDGKYGPGGVYSGLDSFQCKGNETQLLQCAYLIDRHEHSFLADCGVKCSGFMTWEWFLKYKIRSDSALEGVNITVLQNAVVSAISGLSRQTILQVKYWKMRSK